MSARAPFSGPAGAAFVVAILCFGFYAATFSYRPSTDAHLNVMQTRALVRHGDIDLTRYGPQHGFTVERDGRLLSKYGLGITILAAPILGILAHTGASVIANHLVVAILYASAAAGAMFALCRRLFAPALAAGAAIVFAFGTTMWPVATTALWQHAPVAFLVALGLLSFFSDAPRAPFYAGLALGFAAFVRMPLALTALPVGVWYLTRGLRPALRYALGGAIAVALLLVQNWVVWGAPLRSGYAFFDEGFTSSFADGIRGMLLTWWRGLFVYSPVLLLWPVGIVVAARRARRDAIASRMLALGIASIATLLLYSRFVVWWAGNEQFGYRYLLDVIVPMVLLAGYAVHHVPRLRPFAALAAAVSIGIMALGSQHDRLGWDTTEFPPTVAVSPLGRAWDAFVGSPGPVIARLAGIAASASIVWVLARRTDERASSGTPA